MFEKPYRNTVHEVRYDMQITRDTALIIEGYALALTDMMYRLGGDNPCSKSYDPFYVEHPHLAHSYAFDMDGGRHHDLSGYKNIGEIMDVILEEAIDWVLEEAIDLVSISEGEEW